MAMRTRQELVARYDLTGRVAIITGGSRGIGRAIAETYAAAGAAVVIASRKAEACTQVAAEIEANGGRAIAVPTHAGDLDQLEALVAATVDQLGGVDIVVNNAANALGLPIGSITPEAWEKSHSVNLRGPLFLFQYALPHLLKSEHAAVVNVISAGRVHARDLRLDVLRGQVRDAHHDASHGGRVRRAQASVSTHSLRGPLIPTWCATTTKPPSSG